MKATGLPEAHIPLMLGFYAAYRAGWSASSGDLERLAGCPATPSLQAIAAVLDGTANNRAMEHETISLSDVQAYETAQERLPQ